MRARSVDAGMRRFPRKRMSSITGGALGVSALGFSVLAGGASVFSSLSGPGGGGFLGFSCCAGGGFSSFRGGSAGWAFFSVGAGFSSGFFFSGAGSWAKAPHAGNRAENAATGGIPRRPAAQTRLRQTSFHGRSPP